MLIKIHCNTQGSSFAESSLQFRKVDKENETADMALELLPPPKYCGILDQQMLYNSNRFFMQL